MARTATHSRPSPHMLGIIPTWQFDPDPAVNPGLNPYIVQNQQWTQGLQGSFAGPRATILGSDAIDVNRSSPGAAMSNMLLGQTRGLGYVMVDTTRSFRPAPLAGILDAFRAGSWLYDHRKELVWGGVGLAAVGVGLAFLR